MSGDFELVEFFQKHEIPISFLFFDWPVPTKDVIGWAGYGKNNSSNHFSGWISGSSGPSPYIGSYQVTGHFTVSSGNYGFSGWT